MKRGFLLAFVFLIMVFPAVSAALSEDFEEIEDYVDIYNSGEITMPQLIVYTEYVVNKMYEESDDDIKGSFLESEIETVFTQTEAQPWENYRSQFEKVIETKDFNIVFSAHQYYRYDRDYWESRSSDVEKYYTIGYHLTPTNFDTQEDLASEISKLISDLEYLSENENQERFEDTRERLSNIQQKFWNIPNCEEVMDQLDMEVYITDDPYTKETVYYKIIKEIKGENCWDNTQCENVCDTKEVCEPSDVICTLEEVCKDVEICEDVVINETTGETNQSCTMEEECTMVDSCEDGEENCYETTECYDECDDKQQCDDFTDGELRIEARCFDDGSNIYVSAWGNGLDPLNHLNDGGEWTCDEEVEELVNLRKIMQRNFNEEFAAWFFEDFLSGNDYERILNGDRGLRTMLMFLTQNEEEIANRMGCMENQEWPSGFERLEINYHNQNANLEVWEKLVPVEWSNVDHYTTLYKYSWIPDKELFKGLINYQISELGDFGPTPKEIAEIREDEGQMEIINSLSEKYGGSFDISLELNDDEGTVVKKYLTINPNVTMGFFDNPYEGNEEDIALKVDYNSLYDFVSYMSYESEGQEIRGPYWVRVEGEGGPGEFFGALGAMSKFWKEGITITPRYALIKLFFNAGDVISFITNINDDGGSDGSKSVEYNKEELSQR